MHVYIYDSFLQQKKYENILARIETRLTDLGLNGKIARLGAMKNINNIISSEIKRGAKTIIAIGNDETVNKVINSLAGDNIILGIIPVGKNNNYLANALGIEGEEEACNILSARRVKEINLGMANDKLFLAQASIDNLGTKIEVDNTYTIETSRPGQTSIINLLTTTNYPAHINSDPQDEWLELVINIQAKRILKSGQKEFSVLAVKKLNITNEKDKYLTIDNTQKIKPPVKIQVAREKLNVIVGKERKF